MTETGIDTNNHQPAAGASEIIEHGRQLLQAAIDRKLETLAAYRDATVEVERLEHEVVRARERQARAWDELKAADWTDTELQTLKLQAPNGARKTARRSRPKKPTTTNKRA